MAVDIVPVDEREQPDDHIRYNLVADMSTKGGCEGYVAAAMLAS